MSGYISINPLRFLFLTNVFLRKKQSVKIPLKFLKICNVYRGSWFSKGGIEKLQ